MRSFKLGWLVGAVVLSFSIRAGALDFDKELKRQEYMKVEAVDHGAPKPKKELPSLDATDLESDYKVELIPVKRNKSS